MSEPRMEIDFPWEVKGGFLEHQALSFPTALGKAYGILALLSDGTNVGALVDPEGNAKFIRISPDTGFALEEEGRGSWPFAIAEDMEKCWRVISESFTEGNRFGREFDAALDDATSPSSTSKDQSKGGER